MNSQKTQLRATEVAKLQVSFNARVVFMTEMRTLESKQSLR